MELDLNHISELLQALLLAILPALGIYLAKLADGFVKSTLTKDQQYLLQLAARTAVTAAEQLYAEELKAGAQKKEYAIDYVVNLLKSKGLNIDLQLVEAEVESAVYDYVNLG